MNIVFSIDFFKFICAFLIVFMHTYCHDFGKVGSWIVDVISNIGVPFFFIASGFFYTKGILRNATEEKKYFFKYFTRVCKMYIAWSILTLPIAFLIIERAHGEYPILLKFIYLIRLFFFTGSIGIYWYVLALVYNSAIIYYAYKKKSVSILFIFAILFWMIGVIIIHPITMAIYSLSPYMLFLVPRETSCMSVYSTCVSDISLLNMNRNFK